MSQTEEKDQKGKDVVTKPEEVTPPAAELAKVIEVAVTEYITSHGRKKTPELNDYVMSIDIIKTFLDRLTAKAKTEGEKIQVAQRAKIKELQAQVDRAMAEVINIDKTVARLNESA